MKQYFDVLIIGSGVAGLSSALQIADKRKVAIIAKEKIDNTNTSYAQGGVATVTDKIDSYEKHIQDTLIAGDGLCNEEIVKMVVSEGHEQIQSMLAWGVNFDKKQNGDFDLGKEGGHSKNRILHHQDNTGAEIQRALTEKVRQHPNITIFENHFAIDIITQHHLGVLVKRCFGGIEAFGVYVLDIKEKIIKTFLADKILLATGGIGNIYDTTTNPPIATGDGLAMVYRAKGLLEGMEFVQFHPTALFNPNEKPAFLITEALRGAGGILKDRKGKSFMMKYDERESLAPRDIVARAIDNEMKNSGDEFVYLDATNIDEKVIEEHFPSIRKKCWSLGIDITTDFIPVIPAAHYLCGGVRVDENGLSSIKNLYIVGESASTGLHGANRLASNSLLEAVVFGHRAALHILKNADNHSIPENIPNWVDKGLTPTEEMVLITQSKKELQQIMSNYVGVFRSDLRLYRALNRLKTLYDETEQLYRKSKIFREICELRNSINVSYLVIKMAIERKESRGLHYNTNYPEKLPLKY
ncbi:MAG: L-aspartate oxidase [Bacteroidales bacterium]|nr:L-aspartate oxidase [Bacteroidales bacterium]